jgi:rhamnosyltransferase
MKGKKCSFILPTRNVEKYIGPLLKAIYSQEYDGDIEVLIMDSSDDRTPEIAKTFQVKFVRFVRVEPEDYNNAKTRNEGAAMTSGDFLVFLSTDVEIRDKRWLAKLIGNFSDPQVAGVHGRQLPKEDASPMEQSFILQTYPSEDYVLSLKDNEPIRGMVFFSNTNSAIRRSVWEQIKLPEMIISEDMEWAKRTLRAGYKIAYDSNAAVYHSHKRSVKQAFQRYFTCGTVMPVTHANPIINYSMWNFITDGLTFIGREYKFMFQNGYWYWIPYAIVYDIAKFLGIFLGSKQKYMPIWMKRPLCEKKHQRHWDKYKDLIK